MVTHIRRNGIQRPPREWRVGVQRHMRRAEPRVMIKGTLEVSIVGLLRDAESYLVTGDHCRFHTPLSTTESELL